VTARSCRLCSAALQRSFCDLGFHRCPTRSLIAISERNGAFLSLALMGVRQMLPVQLEEFESPAHLFRRLRLFLLLFGTWLAHARDYVERVTQRFGFGPQTRVVELASNDVICFSTSRRAASPSWASSLRAKVAKRQRSAASRR